MSKIAHGFVMDVINKGDGDKPFAIVGIAITSKNRSGFEETTVMELPVRGQQYKDGLHNAYRALKGAEVYAPYADEIDTYFADKPRIRYSLLGVPLRLAEQVPSAIPKTA